MQVMDMVIFVVMEQKERVMRTGVVKPHRLDVWITGAPLILVSYGLAQDQTPECRGLRPRRSVPLLKCPSGKWHASIPNEWKRKTPSQLILTLDSIALSCVLLYHAS